MSIAAQADEVRKVKRSESGVIIDPFFLTPSHLVADAEHLMSKYRISGVPIVETMENRELVGIITNRDMRFVTDYSIAISGCNDQRKISYGTGWYFFERCRENLAKT